MFSRVLPAFCSAMTAIGSSTLLCTSTVAMASVKASLSPYRPAPSLRLTTPAWTPVSICLFQGSSDMGYIALINSFVHWQVCALLLRP
jgi:hypothetical protein